MPIIKLGSQSLVENRHLAECSKVVIYLVYTNDCYSPWYFRMVKKGYKHVFLVKFDGFFWQKLDFTFGFTDLHVLPYDYRDTIDTVLEGQDVTYQRVEVWRKVRRYRCKTFVAPYTCTEAMKSVLGVFAPFVLTPYQLFKYVERMK